MSADLPIAILDHRMLLLGVDLPADLPRSALTTILHIKPGKYEPSYLTISNCHLGGVLGVFQKCFGGIRWC